MSAAATVLTPLIVLFAVSIAVLVGGIVMAANGTGRLRKAGWWIAIVASLFVLAFGITLVTSLIAGASQG